MTTVKANGPADFLALVPSILGYQPQNCIVVIGFNGKRSVCGIRIEHDFPVPQIASMLTKGPRVDGVAVIFYTDDAVSEERCDRVMLTSTALVMEGLAMKGAFLVASDGWVEPAVSGQAVLPLDQITGPPHPDAGPVAAGVTAGTEPIELSATVRLNITAEMAVLVAQSLRVTDTEAIEMFDRYLSVELDTLTPQDYARMLYTLDEKDCTEGVLALLGLGKERASELASLVHEPGVPSERAIRLGMFIHGEGEAPNTEVLQRAVVLCKTLAAIDNEGVWSVGPNTVAGWAEWAMGHGSAAGVYLDRATTEYQEYRGILPSLPPLCLADHINHWVGHGNVPSWMFNKKQES